MAVALPGLLSSICAAVVVVVLDGCIFLFVRDGRQFRDLYIVFVWSDL